MSLGGYSVNIILLLLLLLFGCKHQYTDYLQCITHTYTHTHIHTHTHTHTHEHIYVHTLTPISAVHLSFNTWITLFFLIELITTTGSAIAQFTLQAVRTVLPSFCLCHIPQNRHTSILVCSLCTHSHSQRNFVALQTPPSLLHFLCSSKCL